MNIWYDAEDDEYAATDDVVAVRESEKAILVMLSDGRETWIPKSCLGDDSEVQDEAGAGTLVVKKWFLERQDWY
jgi:hypothetical protein